MARIDRSWRNAQRFADNAISLSTLRDLTDQDLKELGVLLGHRRKMLRAIAELGATTVIAPAAPTTGPERESPDDGERRHLTVMFCDLVGSTALSTRLDPEDMSRVIASYHACIGEVISRYKGMIARYMGAMACSPTSVIRLRRRIMPSRRCARHSQSSMP